MRWIAAVMVAAFAGTAGPAGADDRADPTDWPAVLAAARGQTVYFNAWAGEPRINDYIVWAGTEVARRYGVTLRHVKVADIAESVSRVLADKAAGRAGGGAIDLMWINGENFAAMKRHRLLFGPWADDLPNARYLDAANPALAFDFTVAVEGLEAPWGLAQIVFEYDTAVVADPPRTIPDLLAWAEVEPGRFTYPQPPNFLGSTFLKQALLGLIPDPARLNRPAGPDADRVIAPLWAYLDRLHPVSWRRGRAFPPNSSAQRALLADGEIAIAVSFNPSAASRAIARFVLPDSVRTFVLDGGTIGNANFVAIPFNARAKAGAMVVADFLLSPFAQAHKQDPEVWGGQTVLDLDRLTLEDRARFERLPRGIATLSPEQLGTPLPEPHPSWMERIEAGWQLRYGVIR